MKVCIVGAGAIGGLIGARLATAGQAEVCSLARGATLQALRTLGWRVDSAEAGHAVRSPAVASDRAEELGPQDVVFIAVKAPALTAVAQQIGPLLGPDTVVVPAMNGVPWWFCQQLGQAWQAPLQTVDPGGVVGQAIALERVVGCVVHVSASSPEPGRVAHRMGWKLIVGEPAGGRSDRVDELAALLQRAGFEASASPDIRRDVWYKLWGNMTMNPISALTGATSDAVLADPLVRRLCSDVMREAAAVGAQIGCPIDQTPEDRHAVTAKLGAIKTSMLQDVEAGRPIELDGLVGVVREIAERLAMPTPAIDVLYGLTRLMGRVRGLYG